MARTRKLTVEIAGDASGAKRAFGVTESGATSLEKKLGGVAKVIAGAFVVDKVLEFGGALISAAEDSARVGKQTATVIKSTGKAAHVSADQVADYADKLSLVSGVDDELIQSGENVLLTFKKVRNEVGEGNNIFDQATQAALDMSTAMGTDLQSSVVQIGKALNDPIKGLSALTRVGVSFTQQQKDQIAALVASGDTLGAQKVILKELTSEFQGSAAAQATSSDKLKVAWDNVKEELGTLLLPVFEKVSTWLADTLPPAAEKATAAGKKFGDWARDHKPLVEALAIAVGVVLVGAMAAYVVSAAAAAAANVAATWEFLAVIAIVAALAAGVYYAYTHWDSFHDAVDRLLPVLKTVGGIIWANVLGVLALASAIASVIAQVDKLIKKLPGGSGGLGGLVKGSLDTAFPFLGVLGFANGVSNFQGGLAVVGEEGPELVNLPRGSDVIPNHAIAAAVPTPAASSGDTYNINVTPEHEPVAYATVRELKRTRLLASA